MFALFNLRRSLFALAVAAPTALSLSMSPVNLDSTKKGRVIVLGASGLVGKKVSQLARDSNYQVTGVSRNRPSDWLAGVNDSDSDHEYVSLDLTDSSAVDDLIRSRLPKDTVAVVHCCGVLFDGKSGIGSLNKYASGVGSVPNPTASYDDITRKTVFNALDSISKHKGKAGGDVPFIFVSCAEAGWPDMTGGQFIEGLAPDFLKRYLAAKRSVESRLSSEEGIRPVVFRPSLIYTNQKMRPPPVLAFTAANVLGVPFVDRPVCVEDLSAAIVNAVKDGSVKGVNREPQIVKLAQSL